jgi:cell shape-determining protein MreC
LVGNSPEESNLMNIKTCLILSIISFSIGCNSSLHYTGRSYPATEQIDIFTSPKEIKRPYEVMGTIDGKMSQFADFNQLMEKLKKEAKKQGADAVLILGLKEQNTKTQDSTSSEQGGSVNNQELIGSHSKLELVSPENVPYNELKGQFIKYK